MLKFADYFADIAGNNTNLYISIESMDKILQQNYNLKIIENKSLVIVCNRKPIKLKVRLIGKPLKQVHTFSSCILEPQYLDRINC